MRIAIVAGLALVACRTPPARTAAQSPALATWIPGDVELVIGVDGDTGDLDAVARALGVQSPGALVAPRAELGAGARGLAWMMFDDHTYASCATVAPGTADALIAHGASRRVAGDAVLVGQGLWIAVVRGDVACTVTSDVGSLREKRALELATLAPDEQLLARADAGAALRALPAAPVWAWGQARTVGDGIGVDAGTAMAPLGEIAVAVSIDPATHALAVAVRGAHVAPTATTVAIGEHAGPPPLLETSRRDVPIPHDDNGDVPMSAAYDAQLAAMKAVQAEIGAAQAALEPLARAQQRAWIDAWGRATVTPRHGGVDLAWTPPAWPLARVRTAADDAHEAAAKPIAAAQARLDGLDASLAASGEQLIRIRAADVAAYDQRSR